MELLGLLFICIIIFFVGCVMGVFDEDIFDLDLPIFLCIIFFMVFVLVLCGIGLCGILETYSPFVILIEVAIWIIGLCIGNAADNGEFDDLEFHEYFCVIFLISIVVGWFIFVLYAFSLA